MSEWQTRLNDWTRAACVLEVISQKPGNVTATHTFADVGVHDFLKSADAIASIVAAAPQLGVGRSVLRAVEATQAAVGQNTNLGIVLLLVPLACVPGAFTLSDGIEDVLSRLTVADAVDVYRAIQIASPGGLGHAEKQDVNSAPNEDLRTCMTLAADRDLIARQYKNGFQDVLQTGMSLLLETRSWTEQLDSRIGWVAVNLLSRFGDSLIRRKCGTETDDRVRRMAAAVLKAGWPHSANSQVAYTQLDDFLRDAEHRHNPGTTADMIAAILFAALREGHCSFAASHKMLIFENTQS